MRVWKLEACQDQERIGSRWGYALAPNAEAALEIAQETSGLPVNWVHEKHPEMRWPGSAGEVLMWS